MKLIPMEQLVPGGVYRIRSRNLIVGVWWPEAKGFIGIRTKFGDRYLFTEFHHDADPHMGTVNQMEFLGFVFKGTMSDTSNRALFRMLEAYDKHVREALRAEDEKYRLEAESRRYRPQTAKEAERERRLADLRANRPEDHKTYVEGMRTIIEETSEA